MHPWIISYRYFDAQAERLREALLTLGNGYFATRGAHEDSVSPIHYPGTYLAGIYNRAISKIADKKLINEDLINFPNWLPITFKTPHGEWLDIQEVSILSFLEILHLKKGLLKKTVKIQDSDGRIFTIHSLRFVSQHNPHLAGIRYTIESDNWEGPLTIRSSLIGDVSNAGVARYQALNTHHHDVIHKGHFGENNIYLTVKTRQSHVEVAQAIKTRLYHNKIKLAKRGEIHEEEKNIHQVFTMMVKPGDRITVTKVLSLYHSKDQAITEPLADAKKAIQHLKPFSRLLKDHQAAWQNLWHQSAVEVTARGQTQQLINFHTFHALQTLSKHSISLDYGVPARGLHGEAYRGHVFWDEIYILPLYFYHYPEIARAMLMYRYHRLNAARQAAQALGYRGAMFPWQSASNGEEETQQYHLNPASGEWGPDHSRLQKHVNLAIIYNIWHYYQNTHDINFLNDFGAELILDICVFLNSLASFNPVKDQYEIIGVMGPDEYHESAPHSDVPGLKNNAYTNMMTVWALEKALALTHILGRQRIQALYTLLNISAQEIQRWQDIITHMFIPFHDEIMSQFEDYGQLKAFHWSDYQKKYTHIERLDRILKAEGKNPNEFQIAKQPDVLMLFYLLGEAEIKRLLIQLGYKKYEKNMLATIDYYLARTCHGSTLSKITMASILFERHPQKATELFHQALISDIQDTQRGTTQEGIHLGVMVSTITTLFKNFAGIDYSEGLLSINPKLPDWITRLKFKMWFRQHLYEIEILPDSCYVTLLEGVNACTAIKIKWDVVELYKHKKCVYYLHHLAEARLVKINI